ncbi:MAG: hypothetical protein LBD03_07120 [Methanobrevibacter sp.]|nr:hypothetical protein [Candidatus Methanovirga procula]
MHKKWIKNTEIECINLLDLYTKDYDPKYPVVCLDEKPKQLLDDNRRNIPMKYRQSREI